MHVRGRAAARHMKGKQVPITLYLAPRKYWLLKWVSDRSGQSMQSLLRRALDDVLIDAQRRFAGTRQTNADAAHPAAPIAVTGATGVSATCNLDEAAARIFTSALRSLTGDLVSTRRRGDYF